MDNIMTKERHNITLSPKIWKALQTLKRLQGQSVSDILEEAVKELVKSKNYNSTYFKIMSSVGPCDDKENEELSQLLDELKDNDLKVVETYQL